MKVLILHLSDIHIDKKEDLSKVNINGIIQSLKTIDSFSYVIIVVSGDIAFSGKIAQYNIAYRFLNQLKIKIRESLGVDNNVYYAIVPGNHDLDYSKGSLRATDLDEIFKNQNQDKCLSSETIKMNAFYNFANGLQCFQDKNSFVCIKEITIERTKIQFNLINTGAYSSLDEDQGYHYIPLKDIKNLEIDLKSDYIFSIMHHPHHWFNALIKKELEKVIYEKSDMIFVGHEHYCSSLDIGMNNSQVKVYAGGELSNRGNWCNSEFYAGILELETREYDVFRFKWDVKHNIYIRQEEEKIKLKKNRINKYELSPNKDYMDNFLQDKKYMISPKLTDYYVFPRLEEVIVNEQRLNKELRRMDEFLEEINSNKRVIIVGRNDSGRSALLKVLFSKMIESKCVLFLNYYEIKYGSYTNIIKNKFKEIYSDDPISYEKFRQIPTEDKVLLVDDGDLLDDITLEEFLSKSENEFGIIIFTYGKMVELDIKERLKRGVLEEKYTKYKIQAFYSDKRKDLITNIVKILVKQDVQAQENIIHSLCDSLSKQKNLFRMDPDFIVQFTKYYCNNIGETIQNDGEIFSKVFEANIVSLLKPYAKKISVDKILIILDKIAYGIHSTKSCPINQNNIVAIIEEYNKAFGSEVNYAEFLEMLCKANILGRSNTIYYFAEKNYLAYFVAREIKRRCIQNQDFYEFNKTLEFACYGINTEILMFVTYITDNVNLIRMIMDKAEEYTAEWNEFSMNPIVIPYLSDVKQLKVEVAVEKDKTKSEQEEIQREKQLEKNNENEAIYGDIYSYDEDTELSFVKKMIRALSLLIIISRTLPSFEHMMMKEDKDKCVQLIYSLPLKIFNIWALEVEENKLTLIDEIKNLSEWDYRKEKTVFDDNDALNYIRWESISLLLEMMNSSIGNATKSNTYIFLDSFDYKSTVLYRIAHLMGLDKRDSIVKFITEVEELYTAQKQQLPKLMIQRVAKHYMITSKNIQRENIQRLNEKLWDGKLKQSVILIGKSRNKGKEQ